nr:NADH-quinone oxidoreductase subunit NuoE [Fodinibius sp.]NIV16335.1 NADH-quinone oxidoreductase subunit NuoE [Fodinibius sp.]NIY30309.1 NADH-quinone oxidoreductase subunit NuoE [Fodinibius sp.]
MLSEQEKKEIQEEIKHYPIKRAACIEALKAVQKHRGWISDESIKDIATELDMSPDELDS